MKYNTNLTRLIFKSGLSLFATYVIFQETGIFNISSILATVITFAVFYNLCCLYQVSLHISQNYLIAIILFILFFAGIVYLFDKISPLLSNINPTFFIGEMLIAIAITLILLIPFFLDLFNIIKTNTKS